MILKDIAEQLQQDLLESPREKPKRLRTGTRVRFVQRILGDWGYVLSAKKIRTLAAKAKTYDAFIRSATK
jgi:hypothetical protein